MSSVQGEKKCPKCGGTMLYDFNCRSMEERSTCYRCGFKLYWVALWNADGSIQTDEDEDDAWVGKSKETPGYGTAFVMTKDDVGCLYAFDKPLTDIEKESFLQEIQQHGVADTSYIVTFDPASGKITVLEGECPPDYEADMEEAE